MRLDQSFAELHDQIINRICLLGTTLLYAERPEEAVISLRLSIKLGLEMQVNMKSGNFAAVQAGTLMMTGCVRHFSI